ncbi:phospholipid/cholesterol/gamma-HCH transport system substrate-binding protein [Aeromicrobium panaciterrae]|uniref:Phospholipid/cholesterol/gamma-HCH transport system substrate-binding protein n=1 Tax=Aeromicrobium panaciterrae TaxID=363861 RepID=A0ABU1URH3_9ACTN|nr:MCE family protein [Aeromicrobium panaciterrae]MDR7087789.1 phospholipid/cholesterol/gamma-HCH transport system substrate-binding protein [Aeromicrobium panaciterrae]
MIRSRLFQVVAAGVVTLLVVAGLLFALRPSSQSTSFTLQFTDTTGLYVGNDVQTIGVRIGEVTKIEPRGPRVDVTVRVDEPVAADVGAIIMQSALVTDRFVELTPPWTKGPKLAAGAVVPLERTKAPANVDDIFAAVDDLLVAVSDTTKDGKDIGDLLSVTAEQLEGKGEAFAALLNESGRALTTVSDADEDLTAIVGDADDLVTMLAKRDKTIRSLASSVADSSELFAGQREDIAESLVTLDQLSRKMTDFIQDNETVMTRTVDRTSDVLGTIAEQREAIASAFNTLPLAAENIARAYDAPSRNLRVRLDARRTAPYGEVARESFCNAFVPENLGVCKTLVDDNAVFFDGFLDIFARLVDGVIP